MARVENASVSREIHTPDETWMSCFVHILNNTMKTVLTSRCQSSVLQVVKRIIEDADRSGWNHLLRSGFKLKQESETRLGTYYRVAERLLKSAHYIEEILVLISNRTVHAAYSDLKKTSNIDGNIVGYPGVEAVFDAFGIAVDCTDRFETPLRPMIHIALPTIYQMLRNFNYIANGKQVWRAVPEEIAVDSNSSHTSEVSYHVIQSTERVGGKKRPFKLLHCADSIPNEP